MNKSTRNIVIAVALINLVLVVAGTTIYFVKSKDKKDDIKESTTQAQVLEESDTELTTNQVTETKNELATEVLTTIMSTTKTELTDEVFFKSIAGKYGHASGAGAWYEDLIL